MNCSKTSCQNLIDEHVPVKEVGGPVQLPGKWGVPAKARKDPTPVNMLEVVKPKYGQVPQHSPHRRTETTIQSDSGWIDANFTEMPPLTLRIDSHQHRHR